MTVMEKIEELRKSRGWSKNYLAMEAALTQSTLSNLYARGAEPKLSTLRAICGAFGITLAEFFEEEKGGTKNKSGEDPDGELTREIAGLTRSQKVAVLGIVRELKQARK